MRFVLGFLFFSVVNNSFSQVNIERYFQDYNRKGYMYANSLGFNFASGNSRYIEISNRFRVDYNGEKHDYFVITDYTYRSTSGRKSSNKGLMHLRTIRNLGHQNVVMTEGYTQWQFNEFLLLKNRMLLGGGFRFDPVAIFDSSFREKHKLKVFMGSGIMYEFEAYSSVPKERISLTRSSNYLSFVWAPNSNLSVNLVNYYQLALENFSDYRIATNLSLNTLVTKKLFYEIRLEYYYRSNPYGGKKPDDLEVRNAVRLNF